MHLAYACTAYGVKSATTPESHRLVRHARHRRRLRRHDPRAADDAHRGIETTARLRWGALPQTREGTRPWAQAAARQRAESDPRVSDARRRADRLRDENEQLIERQQRERTAVQQ
jgi:hypothetical protein